LLREEATCSEEQAPFEVEGRRKDEWSSDFEMVDEEFGREAIEHVVRRWEGVRECGRAFR
jgi:hypothetical protein